MSDPTVDLSEENHLTACVSGTFSYPLKYRSNQLIYGTMLNDSDPLNQNKGESAQDEQKLLRYQENPGSYTIGPGWGVCQNWVI